MGGELGSVGLELPAQPGLPAAEQGHSSGILNIQPSQEITRICSTVSLLGHT